MRSWKRLIFYLLLNVVVAAITTFVVLSWWEQNSEPNIAEPIEVSITPTTESQVISEAPPMALLPEQIEPEIALQEHQVRAGDTLGSIALEYDVNVETLMAINGITDPNVLGSNMVIYIPLPTPTVDIEATSIIEATQSGAEENIPLTVGNPQIEIISVVGAGDLASEHVVLKYLDEGDLSMANWLLKDERENVYIFPQLILYPEGTVRVHTAAGDNTVVDLYWGREAAIWVSGDTVTLLDPQGNSHAIFTIP